MEENLVEKIACPWKAFVIHKAQCLTSKFVVKAQIAQKNLRKQYKHCDPKKGLEEKGAHKMSRSGPELAQLPSPSRHARPAFPTAILWVLDRWGKF